MKLDLDDYCSLMPRFYIRVQFSRMTKSSLIQNKQRQTNFLPHLFTYTEISYRVNTPTYSGEPCLYNCN